MSIMSHDAGAPRLMRAIAPRAAAPGLTAQAAAREHVAALAPLWGAQASAAPLVETGAQQLRNGTHVVMFEQRINGVLVDQSDLRVMMYPDKSLAAVSGTLVADAVKGVFVSSASAAVEHALDQLHGTPRTPLALTEAGEADGWTTVAIAEDPELGATEARARKELVRVNGEMIAAWRVELIGTTHARAAREPGVLEQAGHSYQFADATGALVSDVDLVKHDAFVYRVYADTTGNRRPLDGPLQSFAPHPTGVPDGSRPSLIPSSLVVMDAFNGPFDKWLPDNATTTAGNNAVAFADLDANAVFNGADVRPDVRAGRVLNFTYNHAAEPLSTPDQSKAATVNAFFVVNWMHDWWYDSGFTEATRNGQLDNYGRGGIANDPLLIQAQAGANAGLRNNADMLTPADGGQPRMRMFLWTAGISVSLASPTGPMRSNRFLNGPHAFDVTGEIVLGVDATAPTDDGCQRPGNVAGKIALVNFSGLCSTATQVDNAKAGGAIGMLLIDSTFDDPGFFGGSTTANLPGLTTDLAGGNALRAALAAGPVTLTLHSEVAGAERDGDFDNGVVAHEWGHYMHHRLANCVSGPCNGMSEGWGDFNALLLMLRENENRDGTYAMGPYALDDGTFDSAYFGIRRFPYSTDRTKNALSFRHISDANPLPTTTPGLPGGANSEVHNTGEIWAQMLWDVLNVLADEHGVVVARRRMTDYAVGGLLLTPPNASFTEARDAILTAAAALDTDDMTLMAAAFAGRGIGSCAVSPPITSASNTPVVESGTLAALLTAGGATLIDDGISCDHDGILDPGESGQLRVTVANNGLFAADEVKATATTTAPGVRVGAPVTVPSVGPHTSLQLAIPVTLLPTAPRNTPVTITLHVTGLNLCARAGIDVSLTVPTGIDEVANAATIDHVETTITPWTKTGTTGLWNVAAEATGNKLWQGRDLAIVTDTQLVSPALLASPTASFVVKFSHAFALEPGFDGGVIELSTDGGTTWADAATLGVTPGYTRTISTVFSNPLAGRMAYSGTSTGFPARSLVTLDFGTRFAGQSVRLRFRIGTDTSVAGTGWNIDDIEVTGITNTPFPALVSEPSTCTARQAPREDSTLISMQHAPQTSLDAVDNAVCIAQDAE
ncbi:MAG TPA: M36 family metallopeptidase [Kofleriaceae bacterium]|nr:M36 family metallopeptidase [Kofleriaceae bacterium]